MTDDALPPVPLPDPLEPAAAPTHREVHGALAQRQRPNQRPHRHRPQRPAQGAQPATPGPAATPATPVPRPIVSRWIGVDRRDFPRTTGARPTVAPDWMGNLIDNSNLRFAGGYVTGPAPSGTAATQFTSSSLSPNRQWMGQMLTLRSQGWGTAMFYVGFSVGGNHPAPANADAALGTLHGLHLRTAMHVLGADFAGSVVIVDNEDNVGTIVTQNLIDYYNGIFAEMSRPDPNLFSYRPGIYAHGLGSLVPALLLTRRDLFIWDVLYDTAHTFEPDSPFGLADPLRVDPTRRPLSAYAATPPGGQPFVAWSLARQFRSYIGKTPPTGSLVARRLPQWWPLTPFDFNSSFVHSPSYPEAEPRLAVLPRAGVALTMCGRFVRRMAGPPATPPMTRLTSLSPNGSSIVPIATAVTAEPDAPICMIASGPDVLTCTVLNGAGIGVGTLSAAYAWTAIDAIGGSIPPLRQARAIAGASLAANQAMLFMIGADDRLHVKRQQAATAWDDEAAINDELLHPFSRLAAIARGTVSIDMFFIDRQGLLTTAFWGPSMAASWPAFPFQRLEQTASLFPGTALAAVAPGSNDILLFGIGADLRLRCTTWSASTYWSPLAIVGQTGELVGAHSRMAALAIDNDNVELAVLTDSGLMSLYRFQRSGSGWAAQPRMVIADPPAAALSPIPAGTAVYPADGSRINPFGDIGLFRAPGAGSSTVYCAGLRGSRVHVLTRDLAPSGSWRIFV
jgi:hypothetical protein